MGDTRFECAEDDKLTAQMTRLSHVIFFNPRPSPLVNTSMRKRTIYKRIREDLLGLQIVVRASPEFGTFNSLCLSVFSLPFFLSSSPALKNGSILWQMQGEEE